MILALLSHFWRVLCRHEVIGVFMRNWDEAEERGNASCSVEADRADAAAVAAHLAVPLHEADFVRQYWTHVFSEFVDQARTKHQSCGMVQGRPGVI